MLELISIPDGLSHFAFAGFVCLSFFTSLISAAVGIGGGTLLLAVMAQVFPIAALIPVHGLIQLGSNLGRAVVLINSIQWPYFVYFCLGSLVGAVIGGQIVISLPADILRAILAVFILFLIFRPSYSTADDKRIANQRKSQKRIGLVGFFSTLLTMFVGATGPLVIAFYKNLNLSQEKLVATNSASMVVQHSLKVAVFGLLGFSFAPYVDLILLMLVSGFLGTLLGKKILLSLPQKKFKLALNLMLTLLAIRLLYQSLDGFLT